MRETTLIRSIRGQVPFVGINTVEVKGLTHDLLQGQMQRALLRGELEGGYLWVMPSAGQDVNSIEIPWSLLSTLDRDWETEQELPGQFRLDRKYTVDGRIRANLMTGHVSVVYNLPAPA